MISMRSQTKRTAAILIERALRTAGPLFLKNRRAGELPPHPRVLVVRCDHIGDAVMATGAIAALREALRPATLDVLVGPWAAPLFTTHPAVDRVIGYAAPWWLRARGADISARISAWLALPRLILELRRNRYDIVVDLRGDLRQILLFLALPGAAERISTDRTGGEALLTRVWPFEAGLHEVEKNFAIVALLGAKGPPRLAPPPVPPLPERLARILEHCSGHSGFLCLALRGTEPNRSWPVEHAARLVDAVHSLFGLAAIYIGGPGDRDFGNQIAARSTAGLINLAGQTGLIDALGLFRAARAVVAVDSGPMHLAALAGAPILALFGAGNPAECSAWAATVRVATVGAPCGCIHPVCDRSPPGPGQCMVLLKPDHVVAMLSHLVRGG